LQHHFCRHVLPQTVPLRAMTSASKGPPQSLALGRFELKDSLGSGCFGEVYRGADTVTGREVAIKVEKVSLRSGHMQLAHEVKVLERLWQSARPQGFAELLHFCEEGRYNCMVMERLGKNLEDRFQSCGQFSARTTVLITQQVLHCIEYLHSKGLVHRDIKPDNFMCGVGPRQHHLHIIDFGLSSFYYDKRHVQMAKRSLTGTVRYASINTHNGVEQSRRDDLEAIAHMMIYFLRGTLPWSGLSARTLSEKCERIRRTKISTQLSDLCAGLPQEFESFLGYARGLKFAERPEYSRWQKCFRQLRERLGAEEQRKIEDHDFDWNEGKDLGPLAPLCYPDHIPQPDDRELRPRWRGFRFVCGRSAKSAEPECLAIGTA